MCGICGALSLPGGPPVDPYVVQRMRDTMTHRGPDDAGLYLSPDRRAGMGHRRLSIVDLSPAGHGPMSNEDGSVWLCYNGEVYNHAALRPPLEAAGHRYRSRTDTETAIHLYEEHGLGMLPLLRGMFALSIWDERRAQLLLVRDRLGIKPLYYTVVGGQLIWSSEIRALLVHPAVSRDIDEAALVHYLTFAAVPPPATLYAGIHKLPPGHLLIVDREGRIDIQRWWSSAGHAWPDGLSRTNEAEIADHLLALLREAVAEQTMADVPHGLLLSGGVDSSLILALLSAHIARPVQTFSVGFEGQPHFDERSEAATIARRFGADHHELVLEPGEVIAQMPELIYGLDEPVADWVCLPTKLLARLVRDSGVMVVQVGEGSDELFAGYTRYRRYASVHRTFWRPYMRLPRLLRRAIGAVVAPLLAGSPRLREPRDLFRRAARDEPFFLSGHVVHWEGEKRGLLTEPARARMAGTVSSAELAQRNLTRFEEQAPAGEYTSAIAYQDLMVRLPELLLMRVDKMTMLSSVEARVPFLDHRIVELAMALPDAMKLRNGRTKHLLKLAAAPLLGTTWVDRPKKGFDVPLAAWLRSDSLGAWAEHTVLASRLLDRGIFDRAPLERLFRAHRAGEIDCGIRLWNFINLCAWYDHWIEGRAT